MYIYICSLDFLVWALWHGSDDTTCVRSLGVAILPDLHPSISTALMRPRWWVLSAVYVYIYIYIYIYMYIYMCMCMCVYIYDICIYIYDIYIWYVYIYKWKNQRVRIDSLLLGVSRLSAHQTELFDASSLILSLIYTQLCYHSIEHFMPRQTLPPHLYIYIYIYIYI